MTSLPDNERRVEVPFALAAVHGNEKAILDVGCFGSPYHSELPRAILYGIDPREHSPCSAQHRIESICKTSFETGQMDLVLCISTLDHVGYEAYGQPRFDGTLEALDEMKRLLVYGGRLVLTFPFGKSGEYPFPMGVQKVFGDSELEIFKKRLAMQVRREEFHCWDGGRYVPCDRTQVAKMDYGFVRAHGVYCGELEKA